MNNINSKKLPFYSFIYFFCQSIKIFTGIISVTIVAIVGKNLSPSPGLATLPYGFQYLFIMLTTYPISILMRKRGRKIGFYVSIIFLVLSGISGYYAIYLKNFILLNAAHSFLGMYTAGANYFRFAASDTLAQELKSRSVNLVIAGGLITSFIAPSTITFLKDIPGFISFSLCYAFYILLAILNAILIYFTPNTKIGLEQNSMQQGAQKHNQRNKTKEQDKSSASHPVSRVAVSRNVYIMLVLSIISAGFGFGAMGNTMVQSSLHASYTNIAFHKNAFAIQLHTLAMFFPSFFSGYLINKFGNMTVIFVGYIFLLLTAILNTFYTGYVVLVLALILLGLGWNFTYGGGSVLLATMSSKSPKLFVWQGIGETIIALFTTIGAFSPSILYTTLGWKGSNGLILASTSVLFTVSIIGAIYAKKLEKLQYTSN